MIHYCGMDSPKKIGTRLFGVYLFIVYYVQHWAFNKMKIHIIHVLLPWPNIAFWASNTTHAYRLSIILRTRRVYRPVGFYVAFWHHIHYRTICGPWITNGFRCLIKTNNIVNCSLSTPSQIVALSKKARACDAK